MNQRLTRQDMKRNELSTALGKGYDYAESHGKSILLAAGAVLALGVLAGLFYMYRESQAEKANTDLAHAIEVYQAPIDPAAPKPDDPVSPTFADVAARQTRAKALFQGLHDEHGSTVAGDIAGVYLAQIAYTITISLLASWLVAVSLIPMISAKLKTPPAVTAAHGFVPALIASCTARVPSMAQRIGSSGHFSRYW